MTVKQDTQLYFVTLHRRGVKKGRHRYKGQERNDRSHQGRRKGDKENSGESKKGTGSALLSTQKTCHNNTYCLRIFSHTIRMCIKQMLRHLKTYITIVTTEDELQNTTYVL